MSLTLEHNSVEKSLEDWGLCDVLLSHKGMEVGALSARIPGDVLHVPPWQPYDAVILRRDGAVTWRGWMAPGTSAVNGLDESVSFEALDAWLWLTHGFFQQDAYDPAISEARKVGRVALFAAVDAGLGWRVQDVGAQITEIVAACNAYHGGGKLQLGALVGDFAITPPPQEATAVTFEGALRRALAWVPDALPRWDHATSPPTLTFVRHAAATARTRAFSALDSQGMSLRPEAERVARGVRITYLWRDLLGLQRVTVDEAGESSGVGILHASVDLDQDNKEPQTIPAVVEQQYLKSVSLAGALDVGGGRPTAAEEWFHKHGGLGAAHVDDVQVLHATSEPWGVAPTLTLAADAEANAGQEDLGGCTKWLVDGDIPKWLNRSAHYRVARLQATVRVRIYADPATRPAGAFKVETKSLDMRLPVTDLGTNTYTNTLQAETVIGAGNNAVLPPEAGIAAELLAALSVLHFKGSVNLVGQECDHEPRVGDVLNISGGRAEWEAMKTQVHAVTHDLHAGRTTLQTGAAETMPLQDMLQVALQLTARRAAGWISRASGGPLIED